MRSNAFQKAESTATVLPVPTFRIKEAADLLGVSDDTLRRWADGGPDRDDHRRLRPQGDRRARRWPGSPRSSPQSIEQRRHAAVVAESVRNRFSGLVTRVVRDTVMAQVEIQAGPHRFVSLMSREAADELGLEPGVLAVAAVKATNVSVEVPESLTLTARPDSGDVPMRSVSRHRCDRRVSPASASPAAAPAGSGRLRAAPSSASPRSRSLSGTITVFAAASLTESFTELGKQFEAANPGTKVTFSFAASSALATQITQGAPADVFASASPDEHGPGRRSRRRLRPDLFAKNVMEIAVPPATPANVTGVTDLAKSAVKIAAVPAAGALRRDRAEGLHQRQDHRQAGHRRSPT